MHLSITIDTPSKEKLLRELATMTAEIHLELESPVCKGCKSCKEPLKGCIIGGGLSDSKINSKWDLIRKKKEYSKICSSKSL